MSDSDLYTGVQPTDGGIFGNDVEPTEIKELRERQLAEAVKLLPSIEVMNEIIDGYKSELNNMSDMRQKIGPKPTKQDIEVEFQVRDRCAEFLNRLQSEITNRVDGFRENV